MNSKIQRLKAKYRYSLILLRELVISDFKLRYQNSFLGYIWSLMRPLGVFITLYIVFVKFLKVGESIPHFPVYLLVGIVVWNYFSEVTSSSVDAIVGQGSLIRKLNFPRYVMILAGSFSALINLALNSVIVALFMVLNGVHPGLVVLYVPLFVGQLFVFSLGMAFFLSAAFVKLRDLKYIWEVFMQAAFYATPILYPLAVIENVTIKKFLLLNPIAQIMQDIRYVLITPQTETITTVYGTRLARLIPVALTILIVALAGWYFKKNSRNFAENV